MATKLKRLTFAVPPDMEELMDEAKQMFYDSTQSEMIRTLIVLGLSTKKEEGKRSEKIPQCGDTIL